MWDLTKNGQFNCVNHVLFVSQGLDLVWLPQHSLQVGARSICSTFCTRSRETIRANSWSSTVFPPVVFLNLHSIRRNSWFGHSKDDGYGHGVAKFSLPSFLGGNEQVSRSLCRIERRTEIPKAIRALITGRRREKKVIPLTAWLSADR